MPAKKTHGMSRHPAFAVWLCMVARCTRPTHKVWARYGGRGITVCDRWQESFANFWADMGPAYAPGLTLDRIDNDAGYSPENCRWVTHKVQAANTRANRWLDTSRWGRVLLQEAARLSGIGATTIAYRLNNGWPVDAAVSTPPDPRHTGVKKVYDLVNAGPRHRFTVRGEDKKPIIVSNCTQAMARSVFAPGLLRLEAEGMKVLFHVHDEAVVEVDPHVTPKEVIKVMCQTPEWAPGLPVSASAKEVPHYKK